jgi:protoheme IX farnesyltransferase
MDASATIEVENWPVYQPSAATVATGPRARTRPKDFWELTKPRMNFLVLVTTMAGFYMAARGWGGWGRFLSTLLGTALTAAGASVLNQVMERDYDALMRRTVNRPLPAGRVRPIEAWLFGTALSIRGIAVLATLVNWLTALLGAITLVTYLFLYTPAKRHTTLCTIIGAVPGALPAMMGVTAVDGAITLPALALFGVLFVWQMPHFLSIAILYRDDYARGGFQMLPVLDESLEATARQIVLYCLTLIPVALVPVMLNMAGQVYFAAALLLGTAFLVFAVIWARRKSRVEARRFFLASIVYLPALLAVMMFDKL